MKFKKMTVLAVLLLVLSALDSFAQDGPTPVKIDEFGRINCEGIMARLDSFMVDLQNDPGATGYVLLIGEKGRQVQNLIREYEIRNYIEIRRFDPGRIVFIKGGVLKEARTEFWRVPAGADASLIGEGELGETGDPGWKISPEKKPFILGYEFADSLGVCGGYNLTLYSNFLKENPGMRGNIVIYETSRRAFRAAEKELLAELKEKGIARKRLRTFYVRVKPRELKEGSELWLLP